MDPAARPQSRFQLLHLSEFQIETLQRAKAQQTSSKTPNLMHTLLLISIQPVRKIRHFL